MFDEVLTFEGEYLIPMLERLRDSLSKNNIENELSLGDDAIPGVWLRDNEGDIFITFYTSVISDDEDQITIMSLSMPIDGDAPIEGEDEWLPQRQHIRWAFPARNIGTVEELMELVNLYRKGYFYRVLPTEEMTFTHEEESDEVTLNPYIHGAFVRLNHLADILEEEEEFNTGVIMGDLPYLMFDADDHVITLSYELVDIEKERFLLHIRTDLNLDDINKEFYETKEDLCKNYNYINAFTRAFDDVDRITLSADEEKTDYITIHACSPEEEGALSAEDFANEINLFMAEIGRILKPEE